MGTTIVIVLLLVGVFVYMFVVSDIASSTSSKLFKDGPRGRAYMFKDFMTELDNKADKNVSKLFEEMCLINPLKYKDDPSVPVILDRYKKILSGEVIDPDGSNAPSPSLNGKPNPDYKKYLVHQYRAQRKGGKDVEWLREELDRIDNSEQAFQIELEVAQQLISLGLPKRYVRHAITYYRIENFTPKDWDRLVREVKSAAGIKDSDGYISEFLIDTDGTVPTTEGVLKKYVMLRIGGVPKIIAIEYALDDITFEQAKVAAVYVDKGYPAHEAIKIVIKKDLEEKEKEELIKKYQKELM